MKVRFVILCVFVVIYLTEAKALTDEKTPAPAQVEEKEEPAKLKGLKETNTVTPEKIKSSSYGNTDLENEPEDTDVDYNNGENIDEEDPMAREEVPKKDTKSKRCIGGFGHGYGVGHGGFGQGYGGFGHGYGGFGHGGFGQGYGGFGHGHGGFGHGGFGHGFGNGGFGPGYGHGFGGYGGHGNGYGGHGFGGFSHGFGVGHTTLGYPGGFHGGLNGGYPGNGYGGPWSGPGNREWGYGEGFHGDGYPGFFARSFKGGDGCKCKPPASKDKKEEEKSKSKKSKVPKKDKSTEEEETPSKKCLYGDMAGHGCGHPPLFPYNVKWTKTKTGYKVDIKKVKHKGDCNWPWLYGSGYGFMGHGGYNGYGGHGGW